MTHTYKVVGLMSGSSLDGLDIVYTEFHFLNGQWTFKILNTEVAELPAQWITRLKELPEAAAKTLWQAHSHFGGYLGEQVNKFIAQNTLTGQIDFIASHGHTIFHFPDKGFTTQIGDGAALSAITQLPVVCDFRSADVACGGQGTPIVPIGDQLLFNDYRFCLNIGGIANISCKTENGLVAFDICAANQVLNYLANQLGKEYDEAGALARSGELNMPLLNQLNLPGYLHQAYPKSLDNSFSGQIMLPILSASEISVADKLRTYTEHIAYQIAEHIHQISQREKTIFGTHEKMLVTGGGAFNRFLIERIKAACNIEVIVPTAEVVKFKEAIVIALMGVLRMRNQANVLKTVTGASRDTCGGAVYNG